MYLIGAFLWGMGIGIISRLVGFTPRSWQFWLIMMPLGIISWYTFFG